MQGPVRKYFVAAAVLSLSFIASTARAQITSGSITGTVTDSASGKRIPGADVIVVHQPTGTRVELKSRTDGRFVADNLRAGGPYTVTVRMIGYRPVHRGEVRVQLGDATALAFNLSPAVVQLEEVNVVGQREEVVQKSGPTIAIAEVKITSIPTTSRSLQDLTRLSPEGTGITFGGSNYRYNNLTIDGAISNDAFGFSQSSGQATASVPTGTPGGLARTQPISLDAIDQVTVKLAPFDAKVGNFTGGSINAVTRGGTNKTTLSVYSFGRNARVTGNGLSGELPSDFHEYQLGGRLGGAFKKDKAFFFLNGEITRRDDPVLFAPGSAGARLTQAQADQIAAATMAYAANAGYAGYNPGNVQNYVIPANSEKLFGRFDFNLNSRHTLTIRDNFVNATAGNLERGQSLTKLASADFNHLSKTNSLVTQLKSRIGESSNNDLIFGFSVVSDRRQPFAEFGGGTQIFPQIEIVDGSFGQANLGSDRESAVYRQRTRTFELSDNLTVNKGMHTITLGTHNEWYRVRYTFANSYNGRWQYPSLAAFLAEKPSRIRATYILGDNSIDAVRSTPGADFKVFNPTLYLQDEIALSKTLKVTPGVRLEATFTDSPTQQAGFATFSSLTNGTATTPFASYRSDYGTSFTVAPRLGFYFDPKQDGSVVVRGGAGVFQGRMPFAWFAYPFLNNGIYSANVDFRPTYTAALTKVPLIADPQHQKDINTIYGAGNQFEINLIDNHFVQPRVARFNLGLDFPVPGKVRGTLEGTYTKTMKDIYFKNIDTPVAAGNFGGADTRPFFGATRLNGPTGSNSSTANPYSSVFLLVNTNMGFRYNITGSLQRDLDLGRATTLNLYGAYTYGQSKDVANGQRNSPQSNWEYNQQVTPNVPVLTWSNFDVRHRVLATTALQHDWGTRASTKLSLVYSASSGTPFSYVYNNDLNNDGSSNNDLIFIPKDASQITLTTNNWSALDAFITADPYLNAHRGQYSERNGPRTPWSKRLDLRVVQDLAFIGGSSPHTFELTLDVLNFSNMLSGKWGKQYYVPNLNNQDVFSGLSFTGSRTAGTAPSFTFAPPTAGTTPYQIDDFTSRWQMQLGLRYVF